MKSIHINAGNQPYDVLIGTGLLDQTGPLLVQRAQFTACAILSDEHVAPLFEGRLTASLTSVGFDPILITIPPGESSKSLEMAEEICNEMSRAGLDRSSILIALGGGVVGDLGGFVAAIYHRGIRSVQVPTTLLAQVDSSIGGKTAVNTAVGKNMIGAWHHPVLVISDLETLTTLPPRQWKQGFAEIIKQAIISDAEMFEMLSQFDRKEIESLVCRNIEIKGRIVAADERETKGERALLNFGHTIGHAIEAAGEYCNLPHGEAISLGMVAACEISRRKAGLSERDRDRILELLVAFELPTQLPKDFPRKRILEAIRSDKKFEGKEVRFIVTSAIGSAKVVRDVTMEDIHAAIELL